MKSIITFGLLSLAFAASCAKPPTYKGGNRGSATAVGVPPVPVIPGGGPDPLPPNPPPYLGLNCQKPDTFRGLRNWRRLSQVEMINTVRDVFAIPAGTDVSQISNDIPKKIPFDTVASAETNMDTNRLKSYVRFAEAISNAVDLSKFFPCLAEKDACVMKQAGSVASAAWRRPASEQEVANLAEIFKQFAADGLSPEASFRSLIQAILLSPNFMYRTELGQDMGNGQFELTSWEVASALSYSITRHPPDAKLKELAAKDGLRDSNAITAEANRLFADPKARDGMRDFAALWLSSEKITGAAKSDKVLDSDDAKNAMKAEMENLFIHTMFDAQSKTWNQLFTADYTIADKILGGVYGAQPDATGKIKFPDANRRGLLGTAGFLAAYTFGEDPNPITRGVWVTERLLCTDFTMPPAVEIPAPKPGQSNRDRFAGHNLQPCSGCHTTIDNIGFALDNFGTNANFRTMDGTTPITINSKVMLDGAEKTLSSPTDLGKEIAASKDGKQCFAKMVFRYTMGRAENSEHKILGAPPPFTRTAQTDLDSCQINNAVDTMEKNGGDLKSAFLAYISSPAFRLRVPGKDEGNQAMLTDRIMMGH